MRYILLGILIVTYISCSKSDDCTINLGLPEKNEEIKANSSRFSWKSSIKSDSFLLEISTDEDFIDIEYSSIYYGSPVSNYICLNPGTSYYWKVTSLSTGGEQISHFRTELLSSFYTGEFSGTRREYEDYFSEGVIKDITYPHSLIIKESLDEKSIIINNERFEYDPETSYGDRISFGTGNLYALQFNKVVIYKKDCILKYGYGYSFGGGAEYTIITLNLSE